MRNYKFTIDEIEVLRNALGEYRQRINPGEHASTKRKELHTIATNLLDRINKTIRLKEREGPLS